MKRIPIAFGVLFLLRSMFGDTFDVCRDKKGRVCCVKVHVFPDTCIDRFDSCSNISNYLCIFYCENDNFYAYVIDMSKGFVYRPFNLKDLDDGVFKYFSKAELCKYYVNELPEDSNLSVEDKFFYDRRPKNFRVLKEFHINMKDFCLIVNFFDGSVTYLKYHDGNIDSEKKGKLLSYCYL